MAAAGRCGRAVLALALAAWLEQTRAQTLPAPAEPDLSALDAALESGDGHFAQMQWARGQRIWGDHQGLLRRAPALPAKAPAVPVGGFSLGPRLALGASELPPARRVAPGLASRAGGSSWLSDGRALWRLEPERGAVRVLVASPEADPLRSGLSGRHGPARAPLCTSGEHALVAFGGELWRSDGRRVPPADLRGTLEFVDLAPAARGRIHVLARQYTDPSAVQAYLLELDPRSLEWLEIWPLGGGIDALLYDYPPPLEPPPRVSPAAGIAQLPDGWALDPGCGLLIDWDPWQRRVLGSWPAAPRPEHPLRPRQLPPPAVFASERGWHWAPTSAPGVLTLDLAGRVVEEVPLEGEWLGHVEGRDVWLRAEFDTPLLCVGSQTLRLGALHEAVLGWHWLEAGVFLAVLERSVVLGALASDGPRLLAREPLEQAFAGPVSVSTGWIASAEQALVLRLR
jgi:hypothetical protein